MHDEHSLPYTRPARILLFVCLVLPVCGTVAGIYWVSFVLHSGNYPLFLVAIPNAVVGAVLFFGGCSVMRRLGMRVRRDDIVGPDGRVSKATIDAGESEIESATHHCQTQYCENCGRVTGFDVDDRCVECNWFQ